MQAGKSTTWRTPTSRDSTKETETSSGLESSRHIPTKMENRSGRQRANVKTRVTRPTTWRRPKSRDNAKETDSPPGVETSKEVPTKMENRRGWQRANIKMQVARPTTWKPNSRDSDKETDSPPGVETSKEVPTKMESRKGWQRANVKMQIATTWRRPKSRESVKETEIPSSLETRKQVPAKKGGKKAWRKANIKMQIIKTKAKIHTSLLQGGDEEKSKFVLANLEHYTIHPNLIQYYKPLKVTEPHKLLDGNQKIKRFMSRVTEFDQNKTLLIMTNNPPPSPVNWQGKDNPPCYFSQELLVKPQEQQKISSHADLTLMKKLTEPRTPFPVVLLKDAKPRREQWYRFSTKDDFKSEAKYSKLHALKKQQKMYPELSFVPDFRSAARDTATRRKVSMVTWEPLTLETLLEEKPTLTLPLSPESSFRYGRAPLWFIHNNLGSSLSQEEPPRAGTQCHSPPVCGPSALWASL